MYHDIQAQKKIAEKVKLYHEKYSCIQYILKLFKESQNDPTYVKKIESFGVEEKGKLFDVSFRKYPAYTTCRCEKNKKVRIEEMDFFN